MRQRIALGVTCFLMGAMMAATGIGTADTAVQQQTTSTDATATSGAASGSNVSSVNVGPLAQTTFGTAQTEQVGDNTLSVDQSLSVRSGDALAGVSEVLLAPVGSGDHTVQQQSTSTGATAVSADATGDNVATGTVGAEAQSLSDSSAVQDGDNSASVSQSATITSGDSVAGGLAAAQMPATDRAAVQMAMLLLLGLLAAPFLLPRRRPVLVGPIRPAIRTLTDEAHRLEVAVPLGWEGVRRGHALTFADPSTSPDRTVANAEVGVVCSVDEHATTLGPRTVADPSYSHVASGPMRLAGLDAFGHEYDVKVDGVQLRLLDLAVRRGPDIVRVTAYAPSEIQDRALPGLEQVVRSLGS